MSKATDILKLAREGEFGSIENPKRGSSSRCHFWDAFNGLPVRAIKGSIGEAYARAGRMFRLEHDESVRANSEYWGDMK